MQFCGVWWCVGYTHQSVSIRAQCGCPCMWTRETSLLLLLPGGSGPYLCSSDIWCSSDTWCSSETWCSSDTWFSSNTWCSSQIPCAAQKPGAPQIPWCCSDTWCSSDTWCCSVLPRWKSTMVNSLMAYCPFTLRITVLYTQRLNWAGAVRGGAPAHKRPGLEFCAADQLQPILAVCLVHHEQCCPTHLQLFHCKSMLF